MWGPALWFSRPPMFENQCFMFLTISRVTFPSLIHQQCFLRANTILYLPTKRPFLRYGALWTQRAIFPCVRGQSTFLFRPQVEITSTKSKRQSGVTSISLSPAGEGSLLRLERPRSFPSEARGGRSASPSFAGVEGPLCVLYCPVREMEGGTHQKLC